MHLRLCVCTSTHCTGIQFFFASKQGPDRKVDGHKNFIRKIVNSLPNKQKPSTAQHPPIHLQPVSVPLFDLNVSERADVSFVPTSARFKDRGGSLLSGSRLVRDALDFCIPQQGCYSSPSPSIFFWFLLLLLLLCLDSPSRSTTPTKRQTHAWLVSSSFFHGILVF